jgi:hypothetical protein
VYDKPITATLPTFQMAIDQTIVANVTLENATIGTYRGISYAAQANVTFLCLLRDSSQSNPFVSAISLTDLPFYHNTFRDDLHLARHYYLTLNSAGFGGNAGDMIRYVSLTITQSRKAVSRQCIAMFDHCLGHPSITLL